MCFWRRWTTLECWTWSSGASTGATCEPRGHLHEARDGPPHSDRLDECDLEASAEDRARFADARAATVELALAAQLARTDRAAADAAFERLLDRVYDHRAGCSPADRWCDAPALDLLRSGATEPFSVWFCAHRPGRGAPAGAWWPIVAALAAVLGSRHARRA